MASPLLSVIVPAFNRASLVRETLSALVEQHYRPVELIVVDDGSTDGTGAAVGSYFDDCRAPDVLSRLIRLPANGGAARVRNVGLDAACGEYVFFNDSDDLVEPRKLALQVAALEADSGLDFVYGPTKVMETGVPVFGAVDLDIERACLRQLRSPFFSTLGPVFRRTFLERAGGWDAKLPCCQDWEYHLRLTYQRPRFSWVPQALAYYRSRGQGTEGRVSARQERGRPPEGRLVLGQFGRIVSAIDNAPDWALEWPRFRLALRWNAYRVAVLCLRAGDRERADSILHRLCARHLPGGAVETALERGAERLFRLNDNFFRQAVAGSDFVYFRFHGLAGRLRRAVAALS